MNTAIQCNEIKCGGNDEERNDCNVINQMNMC